MLTGIKIENFKSLEAVELSDFKGITVITGRNNSGKSAILQAVNFMRIAVIDYRGSFRWGEKDLGFDLGSFDEVIHNGISDKAMNISLTFKVDDKDELNEIIKGTPYENFNFDFLTWSVMIKKIRGEGKETAESFFDANGREISTLDKEKSNVRYPFLDGEFKLVNLEGYFGVLTWTAIEIKEARYCHRLTNFLRDFVRKEFDNLFFLSADRKIHDWEEPVSPEPKKVGFHGEYAVSLFHYIFSGSTITYNQINDFINKLTPEIKKAESPLREGKTEIRLVSEGINKKINILNVGHGLNQAFSIIKLCTYSPSNAIILIEEPEISLHDGAVAKLLDIFFELAKNGKQIVFTTHSIWALDKLLEKARNEESARVFMLNLENGKTKIENEFDLPKEVEKYDKEFKKIFELLYHK